MRLKGKGLSILRACSVIPITHGLDGIGKKIRRSLTCLIIPIIHGLRANRTSPKS
jgi:hypothetical protein